MSTDAHFEWKLALNFNPWAKFQTFRQPTPILPTLKRSECFGRLRLLTRVALLSISSVNICQQSRLVCLGVWKAAVPSGTEKLLWFDVPRTLQQLRFTGFYLHPLAIGGGCSPSHIRRSSPWPWPWRPISWCLYHWAFLCVVQHKSAVLKKMSALSLSRMFSCMANGQYISKKTNLSQQ